MTYSENCLLHVMAALTSTIRTMTRLSKVSILKRLFCSRLEVNTPPLMVNEVLDHLNLKDGHIVLDMTFGAGLHSEAILQKNSNVKIIALDRDLYAFQKAEALAEKYPGQVMPLLGCFSDLPSLLKPLKVQRNSLDAILIDIGCSSMQLDAPERGFSPDVEGPLDMRMDGNRVPNAVTAHDVLSKADEIDLSRIFRLYGGELQAKKIARSVVSCRYSMQSIDTTSELRDFVRGVVDVKGNRAVKNVFYSLRAFVNNELNELNYALLLAEMYLKTEGRLVTLTFNQLEDTIVKRHISGNMLENNPNPTPLKYYSQTYNLSIEEIDDLRRSSWSPLTKHVITPSKEETATNIHSKAAKLRSAVKI